MKTLLQINPVLRTSTSTGRIMREIGDVAMSKGWRSVLAFSGGRDSAQMECTSEKMPVGNSVSVALHGLLTRVADRHGLGSRLATFRFLRAVKALSPDIIHIHNIHGYFLNYKMLFNYLSASGTKVIWTVHDCWLYTGHCYHYSYAGCERWKIGCGQCPQRTLFPKSLWLDRSARNFSDKRAAFTSMPKQNMVIVPVSQWMREEMKDSFLSDYPFKVIRNGIDLDTFTPSETRTVKQKYGLEPYSKIILGLASIWLKEKGVDDFIRLSRMLHPDEKIVMVGVDEATRARLPENIITIKRTDNVAELAALYSAATAFVNPTWQDNYPTVNMEAQACGTPVVTYRTGGSPESLTPATGRVVEQGDVAGLLRGVRAMAALPRAQVREECRRHAVANFSKHDRYLDYINLYDEVLR